MPYIVDRKSWFEETDPGGCFRYGGFVDLAKMTDALEKKNAKIGHRLLCVRMFNVDRKPSRSRSTDTLRRYTVASSAWRGIIIYSFFFPGTHLISNTNTPHMSQNTGEYRYLIPLPI